jgi:hypothetical protein
MGLKAMASEAALDLVKSENMQNKGGIIRMCGGSGALATHNSFVLLDCTLSDADARGKGFHAVVLAPLRLASVSDILLEAEEG